ncbi:uncharacterized protein J4E84_010473 [Alternaria hordeiaustralica]|uniref:uncharacterized protein n=1 Tax=Alternaria hordeiaustralica TaxID=1187925 RepID=UPI0020C2784C|nr:uncharacterized protein J4E84_010473 [Alternaria hordeiaustralica]KAI4674732.1 hypothetical protein J4E84_010473 [Alternaria hordeiaustralica]
MGRTEKSQGLAPPAVRKDIRAKQARHVVNKVVPAILASSARARRGADGSELIPNPGPNGTVGQDSKSRVGARVEGGEDTDYVKRKGQGRRKVKGGKDDVEEGDARNGDVGRDAGKGRGKGRGKKRNDSLDEGLSNLNLDSAATSTSDASRKLRCIRMITTDALTAAHMLANPSSYDANTTSIPKQTSKKQPNPCILNMASPLRPGGGLLTGATSAEESLCARTTLLPSLKETFYRLPEYGGIYTHDVLVFRSALPLGDSAGELPPTERWYIDVISAGMLRFPELEGEEEDEKRLSKKDREIVESKIRGVMRIAEQKGVKALVLGAWGVGAYGNPGRDVAEAFAKVLGCVSSAPSSGGKKNNKSPSTGAETFPTIEKIIFAIPQRKVANDFAGAFGGKIEVEEGPGASGDDNDEEDDEEDKVAEELRNKIQEMDGQISKVWNPDLKARLGIILDGLKAQLREREGTPRTGSVDDEEEDEDGDEDDNENEGYTEDSDETDADEDDQDLTTHNQRIPGKKRDTIDDSDDDDED